MNRRKFIQVSSVASMAAATPKLACAATSPAGPAPLLGHRFATMCIMVRVTPWEVSRDVKLLDVDETSIHTLQVVQQMSQAYRQHNPEGRLTWGFTMNALEDPKKQRSEGTHS